MRAIMLPLILTLFGLGAGVGAGWFLKPAQEPPNKKGDAASLTNAEMKPEDAGSSAADMKKPDKMDEDTNGRSEFVKLNNQFVVPVVSNSSVSSLVVMSLSLEVETGLREVVFQREPKLRDALLQVMFDHANIGGFDGAFTEAGNLDILRSGLTDTARQILPKGVFGVLIVDLARQDL
ncbi:MAG: flagellar basal body-associated protein FliL [Pseudomonadota bacterium]